MERRRHLDRYGELCVHLERIADDHPGSCRRPHQLLAQHRALAALDDVRRVDGVAAGQGHVHRPVAVRGQARDAQQVEARRGRVRRRHADDVRELAAVEAPRERHQAVVHRAARADPEDHARPREGGHGVVRGPLRGVEQENGRERRRRRLVRVRELGAEEGLGQVRGRRVRGLRAALADGGRGDLHGAREGRLEGDAAREEVREGAQERVAGAGRVDDLLPGVARGHRGAHRLALLGHQQAAARPQRHEHGARAAPQELPRRLEAVGLGGRRQAGQHLGLGLVGAHDVAEAPELVGQLLGRRRRRVEDGRDARGARPPEGRERGGDGHLELRQEHGRAVEDALRDVRGREEAVRAGYHNNGIFPLRVHGDQRHARRRVRRRRTGRRVDAQAREVVPRRLS
mmetsp:Transcript_19376/g.57597  ORF Transcript_19376/g.57597 Transcript_19376/m.57597 type:complete len:401 (-) Transcript_19376:440-1642(-)